LRGVLHLTMGASRGQRGGRTSPSGLAIHPALATGSSVRRSVAARHRRATPVALMAADRRQATRGLRSFCLTFSIVRYRSSAVGRAWEKVVTRIAWMLEAMQEQMGAPITVLANPAAPRIAHQMAISDLAQQNTPPAFRASPLRQRERPTA